MKADGHIHTPYCPHGSTDSFEMYAFEAIAQGFTEITFTEHAPLPPSFSDPTPDKDSGMKREDVEHYIRDILSIKEKFKEKLTIHLGFEVDYIEGFEEETTQFLNEYGKYIDDSILSVHFLKKDDNYYCLDFSEAEFGRMVSIFGSVEQIYDTYYNTVYSSIKAELGAYKPRRIGHITLARKFQKLFPCNNRYETQIDNILEAMKEAKLQLDYNGAGAIKEFCQEPYPPDWVIKKAIEKEIPLIYGSDAHAAKGIGQGFQSLYSSKYLARPSSFM